MLRGAKEKKKITEQSGGHLTIEWLKEVRPREKRCLILEGVEDKWPFSPSELFFPKRELNFFFWITVLSWTFQQLTNPHIIK